MDKILQNYVGKMEKIWKIVLEKWNFCVILQLEKRMKICLYERLIVI